VRSSARDETGTGVSTASAQGEGRACQPAGRAVLLSASLLPTQPCPCGLEKEQLTPPPASGTAGTRRGQGASGQPDPLGRRGAQDALWAHFPSPRSCSPHSSLGSSDPSPQSSSPSHFQRAGMHLPESLHRNSSTPHVICAGGEKQGDVDVGRRGGVSMARHISFSAGLMNTLCQQPGADCSPPA